MTANINFTGDFHIFNTAVLFKDATTTREHIKSLSGEQVHLWRANLDEYDHLFERLQKTLSSHELERAARYHLEQSRHDFIVTRGLLRELISAYIGQPTSSLHFVYGNHGKPFLENGELHFNLSHTQRELVLAISKHGPVGIDLESINTKVRVESVSELVFSDAEAKIAAGLSESERHRYFLQIWTLKEAYLKAEGYGLSVPLGQIQVSAIDNAVSIWNEKTQQWQMLPRWQLSSFAVGGDYLGALATERKGY